MRLIPDACSPQTSSAAERRTFNMLKAVDSDDRSVVCLHSLNLTRHDYKRVAADLDQMGCFVISIEGGEPFIRPDLVEIVRALSKKHITLLYTNGWYVTAENAKALFDAGLTHASVSIDYPDAARHDAKRRLSGAFDRAWRAVDHLR